MILFYNILFFIAAVFGSPLILPVVLASPKWRGTFPYRLGLKRLPSTVDSLSVPEKRRIWIHALSVGEVLSAVPLVKELKNRAGDYGIYFSVSTFTGYELASRLLNGLAEMVFFFPFDLAFSVRHAVRRIDPSIVIIVETDIWPNFLHELSIRSVPALLINARLSRKTFAGYRRFAFFIEPVLSRFARICTQSRWDAERFRELGIPARRIVVTGNVKFDQTDQPMAGVELERLRRRLKLAPEKKAWLAGSTHQGEETIVKDVALRLRRAGFDITLIIAPRDPRRAPALARLFRDEKTAARLSSQLANSPDAPPVDTIIVDTIGELRTLYALADVAFIGGSLVNCGGHNPLEAAAFSKPVLFGPDMSDFAEISGLLLNSGGARQVNDANELFGMLKMLMESDATAGQMGRAAYRIFSENKGAAARNLEVIAEVLQNSRS